MADSKIQIFDGAANQLFPRTRTIDLRNKTNTSNIVNPDTDQFYPDYIPSLDASKITTGKIDAARLPSYVDDVVEVKFMQGAELPAYANATHSGMYYYKTSSSTSGAIGLYYGNGTKWVAATAITDDTWVAGNTWQADKIYVNTYDADANGVLDTYRWTGTAPARITQDIASRTDVRAKGTATDKFVPTEAAVANVSSALDLKITNKNVGVTSVTGSYPIGVEGTAASRNVTLKYGSAITGANGVYLTTNDANNITSLVAKASSATGTANATNIGTVATSNVIVTTDSTTCFGMATAGDKAGTSSYIVPTLNTLYRVTSALITYAGGAGVTKITQGTGISVNRNTGDVTVTNAGVVFLQAAANGHCTVTTSGTNTAANTGRLQISVAWPTLPSVPLSSVVGIDPIYTESNGTTTSVSLRYLTSPKNGANLTVVADGGSDTGKLAVEVAHATPNTRAEIHSAVSENTAATTTSFGVVAVLNEVSTLADIKAAADLAATSQLTSAYADYVVPTFKAFALGIKNVSAAIPAAAAAVTAVSRGHTTQYITPATLTSVVNVFGFYKTVATAPTTGMTAGQIYYVTGTKKFVVATNATTTAQIMGQPNASGLYYDMTSKKTFKYDATNGLTPHINLVNGATDKLTITSDGDVYTLTVKWPTLPGVPISGVVGYSPISTVLANKVTSVYLHYGTTYSNGVKLNLANTTSLVAEAQLPTGNATTIGTVATKHVASTALATGSVALGLDGTITGADSYVVPTFNTLYGVTSLLVSKIDSVNAKIPAAATAVETVSRALTTKYVTPGQLTSVVNVFGFYKDVATAPTTGMTAGQVYYVTGTKKFMVATAATTTAEIKGQPNASGLYYNMTSKKTYRFDATSGLLPHINITNGDTGKLTISSDGDNYKLTVKWPTIPGVPISTITGIMPINVHSEGTARSVCLEYKSGYEYGVHLDLCPADAGSDTSKLKAVGRAAVPATRAQIHGFMSEGNISGNTYWGNVVVMTEVSNFADVKTAADLAVTSLLTSAYTSYVVPSFRAFALAIKNVSAATANPGACTAAELMSRTANANKLLNPSILGSVVRNSLTLTSTTNVLTAATSTSMYFVTERAVLANCLFYSTISND